MAFEYWLNAITFSDGTSIELTKGEVVVIVGPNNSGKSQALRDIQNWALGKRERLIVVKSAAEHRGGTGKELKDYLFSNFSFKMDGNSNQANNLVGHGISGGFAFN